MQDVVAKIEMHLLAAGSWVPTREICSRFGIPKRRLRQDDKRPGLLDDFAVSSTREGQSGYIHHAHLPTAVWLPIKHRLRRHGIAELRRVRAWDRSRSNILTRRDGISIERHTGQITFFK